MKRFLAVFLSLLMLQSYLPSGIISAGASDGSVTITLAPADDTWTGRASGNKNRVQGIAPATANSNIEHETLSANAASKDGDVSNGSTSSSISFMKFDLSSLSDGRGITSAKLKLYAHTSNASNYNGTAVPIYFFKTHNNWGEDSLVWSNAPLTYLNVSITGENGNTIMPDFTSAPVSWADSTTDFALVEMDITGLIKQYNLSDSKTISFAYMPYPSTYYMLAASKENADSSLHPKLEITTKPVPAFAATTGPSGEVDFEENLEVVFSNNINEKTVTSDAVILYKDGEKVALSSADISVDDNKITVSKPMEAYCSYTLKITDKVCDEYWQPLTGGAEYSFNTVGTITGGVDSFIGVKSTVPARGANNVDASADIRVEFSNDMDSVTHANFTLKNLSTNEYVTLSDGNVTYSSTDKTAVINPPEPLDELTAYELTVSGAEFGGTPMVPKTISFMTGTYFDVGAITLSGSIASGSVISAGAPVTNNISSPIAAPTLIAVLYKGAAIVSYDISETADIAASSSAQLTAALTVPQDADGYGDWCAKAFLWNNTDSQMPLAESKSIGNTSYLPAGELFGETTVDGTFENCANSTVTLTVKNSGGAICYFDQTTTDADGNYSFDVAFDADGNYSAYAMCDEFAGPKQQKAIGSYKSINQYLNVWNKLTSDDTNEIKSEIENAIEIFEIDEIDYTISHVLDDIAADIKAHTDFGSYTPQNLQDFCDFLIQICETHTAPLALTPTDDTWTGLASGNRGNPQGVYTDGGSSNQYQILSSYGKKDGDDLSSTITASAMSYMKFDLSSVSELKVTSAILKLHARSGSTAVSSTNLHFFVMSNDWNEKTLTYSSAPIKPIVSEEVSIDVAGTGIEGRISPDFVSAAISYPASSADYAQINIDITQLIQKYNLKENSVISFAYIPYPTSAYFNVASKDNPDSSLHPKLEIAAEPAPALSAVSGPSGEVDFEADLVAEFNNLLDADSVSPDKVLLYKDGEKVALTAEDIKVDANRIIITKEKTAYAHYTLSLAAGICDVWGSAITSQVEYSFNTKGTITGGVDSFIGVKASTPAHNATAVAKDVNITVEFSNEMDSVTAANFKLKNLKSGELVALSDADVSYSAKTATITPGAPLDELTSYELTVSGAKFGGVDMEPKTIRFMTGSALSTGNITITGAGSIYSGASVRADVSVSNPTLGTAPCPVLIVVLYKGSAIAAAATSAQGASLAAGGNQALTATLTVPQDADGYADYYTKAFLWDSTTSQMPFASKAVPENRPYTARGKFFGEPAISGNFANCGGSEVTLTAVDENGTICYYDSTAADADGNYSFDVAFGASGDYTVYAACKSFIGAKQKFEISDYTPLTDYLTAWTNLTSGDLSKIKAYIEKAVRIFDLDEVSYPISHVLDEIAADIKAHGAFGAYTAPNIETMRTLLKNSCEKWSTVASVLTAISTASNYTVLTPLLANAKNASHLGISAYLSAYNQNPSKVNLALVGKSFTDLADFVAKFITALNAPDTPLGGVITNTATPGKDTIYMGAPTASSSPSVSGTTSPSEQSQTIVQTEENYFLDVADIPWAEKEIEFLWRMGVVNGKGERFFAPNDNVLREEYVKLIIEACELDTQGIASSFADVDANAWYYPYVSAAFSKQIVSGISATHFGSGTPITRQDICVMTARALEAMGYSTQPSKDVSFADAASIADYALPAVAYLNEHGIITGTPEGLFNPASYATRAETACIIYRTLDHIKNFASTIWRDDTSEEMPEGDGSFVYTTPTVAQVKADIENILANKSHPYLHADRDKLESIKQSLQNGDDDYIAKEYAQVKAKADAYVATPATTGRTTVGQGLSSVRPMVLTLMTVYYVEGGEKYLNRALDEFKSLTTIVNWYDGAQLDTTMTIEAIAHCYDWLYDYLTDEERKWAETAIKDKGLAPSYEYYQNPKNVASIRAKYNNINLQVGYSSFNHAVYNNSHNIIAALAVAKTDPGYCSVVVANALKNLECYWDLVKDGGFEEPSTYYDYCTGQAVFAMSALKSSLDTLYGYEKSPGFKNTAWWGLYMFGPMVFGDCVPTKTPYSTDKLYFFAKETKNAAMMKRIIDLDYNSPIDTLLWYEKGSHNNISGDLAIPLDRMFAVPNQQVAVFRNHGDDNHNIFTGMYAGNGNATGHSDPVSGLFCLDAFGERFITALGNGDYNLDGYWDNHQTGRRWNYYEKRTESGNCMIINPSLDVGQDVTTTAVIEDYQISDGAVYAIADLQPVYHRETVSYKRGLKLHKNRTAIVVQDEAVMQKPSEIFWSFNTPANIEIIDQSTAMLSIGDKKVAIKVYANVPYEMYTMAAEKLPTSPVVDTQRAYREFRKLAIKATDVTELKLMVELTPIVSELQMPDSISPWIDLASWTAAENGADRPYLNSISVNGTPIKDFDPDGYFYELDSQVVGTNLTVTAETNDGYSYDVIYPDTLPGAIDIEVGDEDGNVSYYRIRVKGPIETIDVSNLTKFTVSKVTADDNDGNVPENVIDGNMGSRWSASGQNGDVNLDLDLGSEKTVKAIGIAFHSGSSRKSYFEIHTSTDGKNWTKHITFGSSSGESDDFENFALNETKARYIRYVGQQNSVNHWNSVTEIAVYGN